MNQAQGKEVPGFDPNKGANSINVRFNYAISVPYAAPSASLTQSRADPDAQRTFFTDAKFAPEGPGPAAYALPDAPRRGPSFGPAPGESSRNSRSISASAIVGKRSTRQRDRIVGSRRAGLCATSRK